MAPDDPTAGTAGAYAGVGDPDAQLIGTDDVPADNDSDDAVESALYDYFEHVGLRDDRARAVATALAERHGWGDHAETDDDA